MTFPKFGNEFSNWQDKANLIKLTKTVNDFEVVESGTSESLEAIIYPMKPYEIQFKAEGERAWRWFSMITKAVLNLDDIVQATDGVQYRVRAKTDFRVAGFFLYDICQGWKK